MFYSIPRILPIFMTWFFPLFLFSQSNKSQSLIIFLNGSVNNMVKNLNKKEKEIYLDTLQKQFEISIKSPDTPDLTLHWEDTYLKNIEDYWFHILVQDFNQNSVPNLKINGVKNLNFSTRHKIEKLKTLTRNDWKNCYQIKVNDIAVPTSSSHNDSPKQDPVDNSPEKKKGSKKLPAPENPQKIKINLTGRLLRMNDQGGKVYQPSIFVQIASENFNLYKATSDTDGLFVPKNVKIEKNEEIRFTLEFYCSQSTEGKVSFEEKNTNKILPLEEGEEHPLGDFYLTKECQIDTEDTISRISQPPVDTDPNREGNRGNIKNTDSTVGERKKSNPFWLWAGIGFGGLAAVSGKWADCKLEKSKDSHKNYLTYRDPTDPFYKDKTRLDYYEDAIDYKEEEKSI